MLSARLPLPLVTLSLLLVHCGFAAEGTDNPSTNVGAAVSSGVGAAGGAGGQAGAGGADNGGGGGGGGATESNLPIRYPAGARHSPLSKTVIEKGKSILAASTGRKDVFAKIGDSNTVNTGFLNCLAGMDIRLGAFPDLQPTIDVFKQTLADTTKTSFNRTTLAAKVGWSSGDLLVGMPHPIDQELTAIDPSFAVVMLGTNDTYPQGVDPFGNNMLRIVDLLLSKGVIPLLTTIPPRADTVEAAAIVPEMNALVRAVAQARQVPMLDLFGALEPLAGFGLVSDGIHLQIYNDMGAHACWFGMSGLTEGMNQRNLITLEALDRMRRFLIESEAPEPRPKDLLGQGTWESPYEIDALPFVDDRDTTGLATSIADKYSCSMANEAGPEVVYRLTLDTTKKLRIRVVDADLVDIDIHFMEDPGGADNCLYRDNRVLDVTAGPGTYWIAADTYVDMMGNALSGPYLLTIVEM